MTRDKVHIDLKPVRKTRKRSEAATDDSPMSDVPSSSVIFSVKKMRYRLDVEKAKIFEGKYQSNPVWTKTMMEELANVT